MSSRSGPTFRFDHRRLSARNDETLLETLARGGWPHLVRSIRYHRPRGPFCGTGNCTGCLVRANGRPNVRACRYQPRDGDIVRAENSWPGPRWDLFGALDLLLPHGIDTLRGLRRPRWAAGLYQRVVRRLAGFGRAPAVTARPPDVPPRTLDAPVVIAGAGRAGREVAAGLVRAGIRPLLLERQGRALPVDGADLLTGTTATFLPPPDPGASKLALLAFSDDGAGYLVRAPHVVVATGGYDGPLLFEGSDRPGVVAADLVERIPGLPFERAVLVGDGPRARTMLDLLGRRVAAIAAPGEIGPDLVAKATELGLPLYPRSRLVRAHGRARVRAVELASRGEAGRFTVRCDAVVLAHRRLPNAQLFFQAGVARRWRNDPGAYYPELSSDGRSVVPGLWGVGSAATAPGDGAAGPESVVAGLLGRTSPAGPRPAPPPEPGLVPYYRELLAERRRGKWVVCPCEDVLLGEIEEAERRGFRGMEVIKRYTGVGTGLCQGRYCLPDALLVLAALEARSPPEVGMVTQRPPLVPTPLSALAGLAGEFGEREVP